MPRSADVTGHGFIAEVKPVVTLTGAPVNEDVREALQEVDCLDFHDALVSGHVGFGHREE